ncbi:MAG: hypothetical protein RLW87_20405 [Alphaproteobacteria bacterium]
MTLMFETVGFFVLSILTAVFLAFLGRAMAGGVKPLFYAARLAALNAVLCFGVIAMFRHFVAS